MYKNLSKLRYTVITGVAALALLSCEDIRPDNSPNEPLELSRTGIVVGNDAQQVSIGVTARLADWTMTGDEEWCRVTPTSGGIGVTLVSVEFSALEDDETRTATFVFMSGDERREIAVEQRPYRIINPDSNEEYPVNEYIHNEILNEWYLWNEETRTTVADYNQGYSGFFTNYLTYLTTNVMDGNTWSNNTRYLYSYIQRRATAESGLAPFDFGMEFELLTYSGRFVGRVLYVSKGSPAEQSGLRRGNWFHTVNDNLMGDWNYTSRIDSLVRPLEGENIKLGMLTFRSSDKSLIDENNSVTLIPARYRRNPILAEQIVPNIIPVTGYLAYNSFDPDYTNELLSAFNNFKANSVTNLVLDLRYNTSGTVEMAELMANLIVRPEAAGREFARLRFNSDRSGYNRSLYFAPHSSGLELETVYILTSTYTAGPAELLINGLRGLDGFRLIIIGDMTEGMNVGMVGKQYQWGDYDYSIYPVAFKVVGSQEEDIYRYGMIPTTTVNEWEGDNIKWRDEFGWRGTVGATEDALLRTALNYIAGNVTIPEKSILDGSSRQRSWPAYPRDFSVQASMTIEVE